MSWPKSFAISAVPSMPALSETYATEAIEQERKGNPTPLLRIVKALVKPSDVVSTETFVSTHPQTGYQLIKRLVKSGHDSEVDRELVLKSCRVAFQKIHAQKRSFWIENGDGARICLNSTLVRLVFPLLLDLAKPHTFEQEPVTKRPKEDSSTQPKYLLKKIFDFCGQEALDALKQYIEEGERSFSKPLPFSVFLQLMPVAEMTGNEEFRKSVFQGLLHAYYNATIEDLILMSGIFIKGISSVSKYIAAELGITNEEFEHAQKICSELYQKMCAECSLSSEQFESFSVFHCFRPKELLEMGMKIRYVQRHISPEKLQNMLNGSSLLSVLGRGFLSEGFIITVSSDRDLETLFFLLSDDRNLTFVENAKADIYIMDSYSLDKDNHDRLLTYVKDPKRIWKGTSDPDKDISMITGVYSSP